jgi:cell division protein FtsX
MKWEAISSLAAADPGGFKVIFLVLIALVIPGFFLLMWLISRSQRGKKNKPPE